MAKVAKKVDVKKVTKGKVSEQVKAMFETQGTKVSDGQDFGFTEGTLVLHMEKFLLLNVQNLDMKI
jgi:hypothetical protein